MSATAIVSTASFNGRKAPRHAAFQLLHGGLNVLDRHVLDRQISDNEIVDGKVSLPIGREPIGSKTSSCAAGPLWSCLCPGSRSLQPKA